jgi:hypothetical protein
VSIGYKNRSAVLPVCTPVFAGDTRRFCRPELFQLMVLRRTFPTAVCEKMFGVAAPAVGPWQRQLNDN